MILVSIYIDDLLITGRTNADIAEVKAILKAEFNIKDLREARVIIRIRIIRDRIKRTLTLD